MPRTALATGVLFVLTVLVASPAAAEAPLARSGFTGDAIVLQERANQALAGGAAPCMAQLQRSFTSRPGCFDRAATAWIHANAGLLTAQRVVLANNPPIACRTALAVYLAEVRVVSRAVILYSAYAHAHDVAFAAPLALPVFAHTSTSAVTASAGFSRRALTACAAMP